MTQTVAPPHTEPAPTTAGTPGRLRALVNSDRFWGWAGPLIIMILGGYLRFWRLDRPHKLVFDETYYVKEGAAYLRSGYELALRTNLTPNGDKLNEAADKLFNTGTTDVHDLVAEGEFVVHPPMGKWMIAAGEKLFGADNPWGWRFAAAFVGTLSLLMIGRIARRLFDSTLLGTLAALLLAIDGVHFVHSRTGLLDIFVMFWALAGFGCLLIDRDRSRARLAARLATPSPGAEPRWGPWSGMRWWRVAAVVCLALCGATKWSGFVFAAVFLTMSVLWDLSARRTLGVRRWILAGTVRDGLQAFVTTLVVLPTVYLTTWTGWLRGRNGHSRQWATQHAAASGFGWVPDPLRSLWHYHSEMWEFNTNLHTAHPYQSNPWSWLVMGRPTAFHYNSHQNGHAGCHSLGQCAEAVHDIGNPIIWWAATLGLGVLLFRWALSRDWRAGAVLAGIAGGYLPWFMYQERTIYTFYAVAFVPWVVLTVTYCLGLALGPPRPLAERSRTAVIAVCGFLATATLAFWFFHPVLSAQVIPRPSWGLRMWLTSWI